MRAFYKPATDSDAGECLNLIPAKDGSMSPIEATKNAVIVQLVERWSDKGERLIQRIVCIECMDESIYPDLKEEALRILRA